MAEYFPTTEWRVRARLGLTYGNDDTEKFYSRNDTRYENVETIKKGRISFNKYPNKSSGGGIECHVRESVGKTQD